MKSFLIGLGLLVLAVAHPEAATPPQRLPILEAEPVATSQPDDRYEIALGGRSGRGAARAPSVITRPFNDAGRRLPSPVLQPRGARNPQVLESLRRGREAHRSYDYGVPVQREFRLPSGQRVDAVDQQRRILYELKPANERAVKRGLTQLEHYRRQLEEWTGQSWEGRVRTYINRRQ